MRQDALLRYMKRAAKDLEKYNIYGPFYEGPKKRLVIFTDGYSAVEVPAKWFTNMEMLKAKALKLEHREASYTKMVSGFGQETADRAVFQTTVGDLVEWLRSCTDACPLCGGEKLLCKLPLHRDELTPEEEDGESVHYAWMGPAAFDRRRLVELLVYMEAAPEEPIEVLGQVDYGNLLVMHQGEQPVASQGVVVTAKQWKIYVAGRTDRREAAPKFHLEGKFTNPQFTHAKKRKK